MNDNEKENFFKKPIMILAIVIVIICILIGIILVVNTKKSDSTPSQMPSQTSTSTPEKSNTSLYDGSTELGTLVEFEINKITLPEAVQEGKSCIVDNNKWYYDLDAQGNAINVYTSSSNFTENVILPSTLDGHKVISIGDNATLGNALFHKSINEKNYWNNIISITVPEGVEYINSETFYGYENLEKVTLPDSVIYIGDRAFSATDNLAYINSDIKGKVVMPKNLQYYGESLFENNKKINSFEFPEQINYIQNWTFYEAKGFTDLTIPKQFKYIGKGAFAQSDIKSLTIENGVEIIGDSAFQLNKKLEKVDVPNSVISIGEYAFRQCTSLKNFNYSGKLKYIGINALYNTKVENILKNSQLP